MGGEQVTLSLSTEEPDFLSQILYQISGGHTMERDASQQPFRRRNARVDEFLDSTVFGLGKYSRTVSTHGDL